ncbi:MAG TPA: sulfurtransferase [Vicinamibacterales bacterium]|nr:sulfurtransferase [Vicinamibacterales bacterium]
MRPHRSSLTAVIVTVCLAGSVGVAAGQMERPATQPGRMVVTPDWLAAHVEDDNLTLLHVGTVRGSYDAGHLPGARYVALSDLVVERQGLPNELPPAAHLVALFEKLGVGNAGPIVIYGDDKGLFAARLFFTLDYLGHGDRAMLLDGGLDRWTRENRALSAESRPVSPRPFTPRLNPNVVAALPAVRDISWAVRRDRASGWALLDARPDAQFTGGEAGQGVSRPGHIPGAASFFWERALVSPDDPVLRPVVELQKLMAEAGAPPPTRVVTYCRTGVQASFAYFVARYLGYDVKLYDGSFLEWSRAADTEIAQGK